MTGYGTWCPLHDWEMEGRECICDTRLTKPVKTRKTRHYKMLTSWCLEVFEVGEEFDSVLIKERVQNHDFSERWINSVKNIRAIPHEQKWANALKKHPDFECWYDNSRGKKKIWYRRIR